MRAHDCEPTDLTFFERTVEDLAAFVAAQDVFWVAGGSTANLLAIWRLHGLDELLRDAHARGAVLAGGSAGGDWRVGGAARGPLRAARGGGGRGAGPPPPPRRAPL